MDVVRTTEIKICIYMYFNTILCTDQSSSTNKIYALKRFYVIHIF